MFKCLECGRTFKTVRAAEKASFDGCPKCGGVDIDVDPDAHLANPKKHSPTPVELANDPSLKWCPYRYAELVWSDAHRANVRFLRYEGEQVVLATLDEIAEMPGRVNALDCVRNNKNSAEAITQRTKLACFFRENQAL